MRRLILFLLFSPCVSMAQTMIATNNAAILYSPYNWVVTGSSAKTINPGAYFRTIFAGTSVALTFSTTDNLSPYSQLYARVDGDAWQQYTLTSGNPTWSIATGLANRKHMLEVLVKSTSHTISRWTATPAASVTITGIVLDSSTSIYAPVRHTKNVIIFGDSITEGESTAGNTQPLDTDQNDILSCWSYGLVNGLDAEVGIVGFAGTGLAVGYDGVLNLPVTYAYTLYGVARTFSPTPDLVIYHEGQNDGAQTDATVITKFQIVMTAMASIAPSAKQLVLIPLSQNKAGAIITAVTGMSNSNITYASTSGWLSGSDTVDGVHPWGYASAYYIAPKVLPLAQALLYPSTTTVGSTGPTGFVY